ncbi:hypothetical protein EDF62_0694 [Leucobacter luti]|uniref:Uncharacterized protein n=1 Tax=Leucobacter luti TaxID=340320 RepID=A0A4R6S3R7_9MICO|nr:hypothetical protein [Leucobacter luti]TDP94280.1 hypothetical protein EDF62_0694 [Leucobacter luti]
MSVPQPSQTPPVSEREGLAGESAVPGAPEAESKHPEKLPMGTWVTLSMFALFVVAFGTCASTFLFN